MFGRSFKPAKCKTALRLAISRIKLLKNKRDLQLKQMRRDLAQLLQSGQEPSAMIRVEHVMREQNIIGAYEFIELFCELIVARLPIIESQKNCPNDLLEAISSLIFAAPRCADIPELSEIRSHFGLKYGKEFVASAAELCPECGVNRQVIEKLSARAPSGEDKLKIMKEIAKEYQIKWDPSEAEKDLFKPPEDLLNGPSKFIGATQIPTEHNKESYQSVSGKKYEPDAQVFTSKMTNSSGTSHSADATHYMAPSMSNISKGSTTSGRPSIENSKSEKRDGTDSSVSSSNIEQKPTQAPASEKSMKATDLHQENLEKTSFHSLSPVKTSTLTPTNTPDEEYDSSQQSASHGIDQYNTSKASSNVSNEIGVSNSQEWNMNFKDVASAARAAAFSAEMASEAAKAAAELSKHNTFQKKDSSKTRATSISPSSSDRESMELNSSRITRRPSSNEYVQPEIQPLHGNDLSGGHYVESHSENANSHHSASWQSSQQKGTGEIDNEYALPMKSTSRLESYQWPSDEITDDDTVPITRKSASIRREGRQYIDSKQEKPYARKDSDFSNSVDGSRHWKMDTMTSHSNTQPSEDFYDSFNRKSESAKKSESKRSEDSRNTVTELPLFDDSPHGVRSDIKWNPQKNEHASVVKSSTMDEAHNNLYQLNTAFQPPIRPPPGVPESSKAHTQYSFSNNNRPLDKVSTPPGHASYDSSSSEDDMSNSRRGGKPSSNDLDRSIWHSAEAHEKNGKPRRKVHHQNEIANAGNEYANAGNEYANAVNEYDVPITRTVRTDLNHRPSNRVYHDGNKPFENKSQTFRREHEDQINSGETDRQQTDNRKLVEEPLSGKGKTVYSHSHLPSNRVFHDGNQPHENKSKPFRREQEDQINDGVTNRQQTDIRNLVEEPLSRKGNAKVPRSHTRASDIFRDSDSMASESDKETELGTHNDNVINSHRLPLFSNTSHSTSSNSKHENPKHTEKVSASTLSSVNETRVHPSQPNLRFQPPKQPLSGLTASSEASSQSPSSAGESKAQRENSSKRAAHVHPKLPDYDDLAAKFASMKRQ